MVEALAELCLAPVRGLPVLPEDGTEEGKEEEKISVNLSRLVREFEERRGAGESRRRLQEGEATRNPRQQGLFSGVGPLNH